MRAAAAARATQRALFIICWRGALPRQHALRQPLQQIPPGGGVIHGRLITAWSAAGVIGPFLIANLRQFEIKHGVPHAQVYDIRLYIMAGLLFCGLICNAFVTPVHDKHLMTDEEAARERTLLREDRISADVETAALGGLGIEGILAWAAVGIPFLIGLNFAPAKAKNLF